MTLDGAAAARRAATIKAATLPRLRRPAWGVRTAVVLVLLAGCAVAGAGIAESNLQRLTVAAAIAAALGMAAVIAPDKALLGLAGWLVALGTLRRLAPGSELAGLGDPLLLVGPAVLLILLMTTPARGGSRRFSVLAYSVLAFQVLAVLSALNPLQGGLQVGLAGLLFVPAPVLGFWVGRAVEERTVARLLRFIAVMSIPVALYGLWQTLVGFPPWDQVWITQVASNYVALNVGGAIRPFWSLSSAAEYAFVLGIGIVVLAAGMRRGRSTLVVGALMALLAASVLLESVRTVAVTGLLALAVMVAARLRWSLARALAAGIVLVASIPTLVGLVTPQDVGSGLISGLVAHQLQGLSDPFGPSSTLPLHIQILLHGLTTSLSAPLGLGVGAVSIAASHFGGATAGTEVDPGNAAVALGMPGLILYLFIAATGLWRAYDLARTRGDFVSLALLGLLLVTALQWLNGGQYAVAWLVWVAFGAVDAAAPVRFFPEGRAADVRGNHAPRDSRQSTGPYGNRRAVVHASPRPIDV